MKTNEKIKCMKTNEKIKCMKTNEKFDWGKWDKNRGNSRMPTEREAATLVKMFQECPWCLIRDILIDSGITDESFPNFFYDVLKGNLQTFKRQ